MREVWHQVRFPMRVEVLHFHGRLVHQQAEHTQQLIFEVIRIRAEEEIVEREVQHQITVEEFIEEVVEVPRVHIVEEILVREVWHQVMFPKRVEVLQLHERLVHQQAEHS